jgi:hypothetical protein
MNESQKIATLVIAASLAMLLLGLGAFAVAATRLAMAMPEVVTIDRPYTVPAVVVVTRDWLVVVTATPAATGMPTFTPTHLPTRAPSATPTELPSATPAASPTATAGVPAEVWIPRVTPRPARLNFSLKPWGSACSGEG